MCDIDKISAPNILFLKGIYFHNCKDVSDIMTDRLAEIAAYADQLPSNLDEQKNKTYDPIPRSFTNVTEWVKSTNLLCWECGCSFSWSPVFIPTSITRSGTDPGTHKPITPIGNYCSFMCARNWINEQLPRDKQWEKMELLKILHKLLTGESVLNIPNGPNKTQMQQYGGVLSVAEFQSRIKLISTQSGIKFPPHLFAENVTTDDVLISDADMLND